MRCRLLIASGGFSLLPHGSGSPGFLLQPETRCVDTARCRHAESGYQYIQVAGRICFRASVSHNEKHRSGCCGGNGCDGHGDVVPVPLGLGPRFSLHRQVLSPAGRPSSRRARARRWSSRPQRPRRPSRGTRIRRRRPPALPREGIHGRDSDPACQTDAYPAPPLRTMPQPPRFPLLICCTPVPGLELSRTLMVALSDPRLEKASGGPGSRRQRNENGPCYRLPGQSDHM